MTPLAAGIINCHRNYCSVHYYMAHRQHAVLDAVYYYRCRKWRGLQCWVAHDTLYKTTEPIMNRFEGKLWWAQETIIRWGGVQIPTGRGTAMLPFAELL